MSISYFEYLSILCVVDNVLPAARTGKIDYPSVLEHVRSSVAQNHADELAATLESEDAANTLKTLILKYAAEYLAGQEYDHDALVERIYQDMAGLGLLTQYLYDPSVEEINVNGYHTVEIGRAGKVEYLHGANAFSTAESAVDIAKRMVRMGGFLLDAQTPRVDSYIGAGTRISAMIPPLVPDEQGVIISIRKQHKGRITRDQLIASGAATPEMLDFLVMCLCYGVSVGIAGGTGSGKSTLMNYLLNEYICLNEDFNNRIYIIEDSRELTLLDYDEENDRPARVLYTMTKGGSNPVTMLDQIISSLRFHPNSLVPAEVRDGAAYQAAIAGQTGHTILTSFHADGAKDAYRRLVALCNTAGNNMPDEQILDMCIGAWPIIVYQKQLKDASRKIMEVFEATGQKAGQVKGHMLFRFEVGETIRDGKGHITKVAGRHKQDSYLSPQLYKRLRDNGAPLDKLQKLRPKSGEEDLA